MITRVGELSIGRHLGSPRGSCVVISDLSPRGLDGAEVDLALTEELPTSWMVRHYGVPPLDSVSAGFMTRQLAGIAYDPDICGRVIYVNVAGRTEDDSPRPTNGGEPLCYALLKNGVVVVACMGMSGWQMIRDQIAYLAIIDIGHTTTQFRSARVFPTHVLDVILEGTTEICEKVDPLQWIPQPARGFRVSYIDGFGQVKLMYFNQDGLPVNPPTDVLEASRLQVIVPQSRRDSLIEPIFAQPAKGIFAHPPGQLVFAPGSSGHEGLTCWELAVRMSGPDDKNSAASMLGVTPGDYLRFEINN